MRSCLVQMKGKDGQTHSLTLEAASAFHVADQAIQFWGPTLVVRLGDADCRASGR